MVWPFLLMIPSIQPVAGSGEEYLVSYIACLQPYLYIYTLRKLNMQPETTFHGFLEFKTSEPSFFSFDSFIDSGLWNVTLQFLISQRHCLVDGLWDPHFGTKQKIQVNTQGPSWIVHENGCKGEATKKRSGQNARAKTEVIILTKGFFGGGHFFTNLIELHSFTKIIEKLKKSKVQKSKKRQGIHWMSIERRFNVWNQNSLCY